MASSFFSSAGRAPNNRTGTGATLPSDSAAAVTSTSQRAAHDFKFKFQWGRSVRRDWRRRGRAPDARGEATEHDCRTAVVFFRPFTNRAQQQPFVPPSLIRFYYYIDVRERPWLVERDVVYMASPFGSQWNVLKASGLKHDVVRGSCSWTVGSLVKADVIFSWEPINTMKNWLVYLWDSRFLL